MGPPSPQSLHVGIVVLTTKYVFDHGFLQCYFLLSASSDVPIIYQVERVRKGRSYSSCAVKAVQKGRIVFVLLCSFQIPEPWHPSHQWAMPQGIPDPDKCELEEVVYGQLAQQEDRANPAIANVYRRFASVRGN
jgi:acyl-CoA thioesterase II